MQQGDQLFYYVVTTAATDNMTKVSTIFGAVLILLSTRSAGATILSVDAVPDGSTDASITVSKGENFDIDIVISDAMNFSGF